MEKLIKEFEDLKNMIQEVENDFTKFTTKGNSAAGTRVRKVMLEIKEKAHNIRTYVQEVKNSEK